jgi:TonB family protein
MKRYLPLIFLLFAHSILAASDKANREGADLVEQAEAKANIFELPSFEMKATVRIDNKGNPVEGSYMLLWNGPEQWREEISLPGYSDVTIGGKGVVSVKRSTDFLPLQIEQLHRTLGYGHPRLARRSEETVKQVHHRNVNGVKVDCEEIIDQQSHTTREVCVDRSTGVLIRQQPFLDGDVMPIGTKLFPRFLSYVQDKKTLAEVHVTEFKPTEQIPSPAFDPPVGAVSKPGCWNPNPGRVAKKLNPSYPPIERYSHHEGTVAIYAVIGADGVPHDLGIVSGVTPGLNKASLDAVQQWRYEPFTCNGIAIDVETIVLVSYSLSQ